MALRVVELRFHSSLLPDVWYRPYENVLRVYESRLLVHDRTSVSSSVKALVLLFGFL